MTRKQAAESASALVAKMTVEEAVSQLTYASPEIEHLNVPAYNWWNEALHGVARAGSATVFPQAIAFGATFDPDFIKSVADMISTEGRAKYSAYSKHDDRDIYKGLTFWSPNINIFRDPRWGRGHETYGEDPFLTAEIGKAFVRGLQGDGDFMKSAACAKHFAVHSGPESMRHSFNALATKKDLAETYLPAFESLVTEANVEAVMGAYNRTNGEPCCGSKTLMIDILRGEWGFKGHFVSDCWAIQDFHLNHKITSSPEDSAALACNCGCDLNCGVTYIYLYSAFTHGKVTEEQIRTSAVRLFTTRYLLGIMPDGEHNPEFESIPYTVVECEKHLEASYTAAVKSTVLLKNDGVLPFKTENLKTIAVIGPNADSRACLMGNYYGTASHYTTVLEGTQNFTQSKDIRVLYSEGCNLIENKVEPLAYENDRLSEAINIAEQSDAVILVVGLNEKLEGEEGDQGNASASGDKRDLLLPESQRRLMKAVLETGKPTVICLLAGSSIDLEESGEQAGAILDCWYPGAEGGKAVADILFGKVSPSGKLPVTFYKNSEMANFPDFTDYSMKNRTYKYYESEPLYPFGYGLTYGDTYVKSAVFTENNSEIKAEITVSNDGNFDTEDVVQIYCKMSSEFAPRNPKLVGFKRIFIKSKTETKITIEIPEKNLLVVNENGEKIKDGTPTFYAGMGQPDKRTEKLTGRKSITG
ncbi:MAG: glycoside hydrolase family 3 C-terminal domain-containing protein [Ruminococcus sp.]|jgi:beta-glucosidase|nr:glycoside hydrolase family 3 C-terminal domain-containing protein [Ruminococcus sp.]